MKTKIYNDGMWGFEYDTTTKTMKAGYTDDSQSFIPSFVITEIDEDDVDTAIVMCAELYKFYGVIVSTFANLKKEFLLELG